MKFSYTSVASLCGLVANRLPTVVSKTYDRLQPLGFGIYTGGADIFSDTVTNPSCGNHTNPDNCPSFLIDGIWCATCILNPECKCNLETKQCEMVVGGENGAIDQGGIPECYLGKSNLEQDVAGRVAIMTAAVEKAYELSDKDPSVLKIFNAPEFYWRGPQGAYPLSSFYLSQDSFQTLIAISVALEKLVEQKRFQDWLFIFGTGIAAGELQNEEREDYLNVAPIYRGFDPETSSPAGKRFLVPKRYISSVDFLSTDRLINANATVPNPFSDGAVYDNAAWNELRSSLANDNYWIVDNNWMIIDGIVFSIEICLDHAEKVASESFVKLSASGYKIPTSANHGDTSGEEVLGHTAQISIVTSAGMSVTTDSLVLTNGGTIFLQDGHHPSNPQVNTCYLAESDDLIIGYSNCIFPDNQGYPSIPFTSVPVYDTEEEARAAMVDLYSTLNRALPQIHVFEPIPIVKFKTDDCLVKVQQKCTCPSSSGKKGGGKEGKKSGGKEGKKGGYCWETVVETHCSPPNYGFYDDVLRSWNDFCEN